MVDHLTVEVDNERPACDVDARLFFDGTRLHVVLSSDVPAEALTLLADTVVSAVAEALEKNRLGGTSLARPRTAAS